MSRKNNLKRRRVHHAAMLADERAREAVMKKNRERRQASKGKSEADAELSVAMEGLGTADSVEITSMYVPKIGMPVSEDKADVKMGITNVGHGRIRKKRKKDMVRSKKVKERMLQRQAMAVNKE